MSDDDDDDIPTVIPQVTFDENGEPLIAKEMVVEKSPIPKLVLLLTMLIVVATLASQLYFEKKRNDEADRQHSKDEKIAAELQRQQDFADQERLRLQNLVIAILGAKTSADSRKALEAFLAAQRQTDKQNKADSGVRVPPGSFIPPQGSTGGGNGGSTSTSGSGTGGGPGSSGNPQPSPTPQPTPNPHPSPTPSPTPTPLLPAGPIVCRITGICTVLTTFFDRFGNLNYVFIYTANS
jgi:hypothetical protein